MSLGLKEIINNMRPEISENIGFGETQGKEVFNNAPLETFQPSKNLVASLNLDNKKASDFIKKMEEDKIPEDGKNNLSDKVRQELRAMPKIDSENSQETIKAVIDKLGIQREEDKNIVEAKVGVRANISRNLERMKMLDKEGQGKIFRDFAIEDSKWMQKIGDYIKSIKRDKPISKEEKRKRINDVWREMQEIYNDYEIYYKDFKLAGGKDVDDFESNKNGILGQVAAEELFVKAGIAFKEFGITGIRIEPATPTEDVDKKTDFYVVVEFGKNLSKVFPCQVKSHVFDSKSGGFIANNLVVRVSDISREGLRVSAIDRESSSCENNTIEDVEIFRKKALPGFKEGFFVIVPHGKAEVGEGKKEKVNLLEDDGEVNELIEKGFLKQLGKNLLGIDIYKKSGIISKQKKGIKKGGNKR